MIRTIDSAVRNQTSTMNLPSAIDFCNAVIENKSPRQVLIVEDEPPVRELLRLHLELTGFAVEETGDGRDALRRLREHAFNLVILDVMLPGIDGVSLCRAIRAEGPNVGTPILMLTARDAESDKVLGLESGADDYLTKPFGIRELLARVGAITRRHGRADHPAPPSGRTAAADVQLESATSSP